MNVLCNRYGLNQFDLPFGMVPRLIACQKAGLISEMNGQAMDWCSPLFWAEFLRTKAYPGFYHTVRPVIKDCVLVNDFVSPLIYNENAPCRFATGLATAQRTRWCCLTSSASKLGKTRRWESSRVWIASSSSPS